MPYPLNWRSDLMAAPAKTIVTAREDAEQQRPLEAPLEKTAGIELEAKPLDSGRSSSKAMDRMTNLKRLAKMGLLKDLIRGEVAAFLEWVRQVPDPPSQQHIEANCLQRPRDLWYSSDQYLPIVWLVPPLPLLLAAEHILRR